jgi:hypothetical protein
MRRNDRAGATCGRLLVHQRDHSDRHIIRTRHRSLLHKEHWPFAEKVLDGVPTILVTEGMTDEHALRRSRIDVQDAAREKQGLERLDQIKFVVLEVGGDITIVPK